MTIDDAIVMLLAAKKMFGGQAKVRFTPDKKMELTDADTANGENLMDSITWNQEWEEPGRFNSRC